MKYLRFSARSSHGFVGGFVCCLTALALAACGGKAKPDTQQAGPNAVPIPDGPGCPSASSVMVAVWREASPGVEAGWTLPLANKPSTATAPVFQLLDDVGRAALPAAPAKLWLLAPGVAPCEATPAAAYSDVIVDGHPNEILGVQLTTSCPAPAKDQAQQQIALAADAAPTGCVAILPRPVAGRVGEAANQTWQIVPQSTPMPPAIEAAVPNKPCEAPCEKLWTVSQLEFGGHPIAWDVALEWLQADPAQPDVCQWKTEHDGGIYVANAIGAAEVFHHEHAIEPLHLGAVLADRAGAKVLVLEHIGEYSTFDLSANGKPAVGRHLRWYTPNEELYAGDRRLGPYCGP